MLSFNRLQNEHIPAEKERLQKKGTFGEWLQGGIEQGQLIYKYGHAPGISPM